MKQADIEYVKHFLIPGERPIAIWRHHWLWWLARIWLPGISGIALMILSFLSEQIVLIVIGLILLVVVFLFTRHWRRRIVFVSTLRVGEVGGLFKRVEETDVASLVDIQNIDIKRPGLKALLFRYTDYLLQTGHGSLSFLAYPPGIDKTVWSVKHGDMEPQSLHNDLTTDHDPDDPPIIVH